MQSPYELESGVSGKLQTVGGLALIAAILIFPSQIAAFIRNPSWPKFSVTGTNNNPATQNQGATNSGTTFEKALEFTGIKEGACQRWGNDNGNWYQGRLGATCWGIVPATAQVAINNGLAVPGDVSVWDLDKWYNRDKAGFLKWGTEVYKRFYFDPLKLPENPHVALATVAFDANVNAGLGNRFLTQTASIKDQCKRAEAVTGLLSDHYERLIAEGYGQPFKNGWRARAVEQKRFIQENCK